MIDSLNNFHYFSTEVEVVTAAAMEVAVVAEVGTTTEAKTGRPETGGRARPQPRVVETTGRTDTNRLETEVSFCVLLLFVGKVSSIAKNHGYG
jgi:hypothetical protein